jgi:GH24 family phage-related lysozyme (muramidase)
VRQSVRDAWLAFTEPLEGGVSCLYNDVRGKTTIAYGNLCDTAGEAAALPLVHPDGTFATTAEKIAAWRAVHDDPNATTGGWRYAARLTPLRLTREGMAGLALARLELNDRILLARLPEWESYVACAQMAMHSLAWACGANAHFPRLFQAVTDRDFDRAAIECHMNEWTPEGIHNVGLVPRNVATRVLMRNAQRVEAFHLDPDLLDWTHDLSVAEAPTLTELPDPPSEPTTVLRVDPGTYLRPDDEPDTA